VTAGRLALLVVAVLLAGCADLQSDRLLEDPGDLPPKARVAGVPFYAQKAHYCGPASLAMVLSWAGQPVSQEAVAPQVFTPDKKGAFRSDILGAARRRGQLAVVVRGMADLLGELSGGHPVLVFQNLGLSWYPRWHFAVAIGYDLGREDIILHSGTRRSRTVAMDTFERTWARTGYWGMVALPPGQLPVTADATAVLQAAVGLERAGQVAAAARAYAAATKRWPGRLGGWIGLANARYRMGDLQGAAKALRGGLEHHPDSAEAWNNLAVVLGQRGRRQAAVAAAERAVELADERSGIYRETLKEVRAGGGG
jgi:hypothetical protein